MLLAPFHASITTEAEQEGISTKGPEPKEGSFPVSLGAVYSFA